jgi:Anti-sigma-K factor rskA, C-terminal
VVSAMREGRCPNEELAVGWALHALEPDDEHVLRTHLPGCPVCQEIVRSTEEVTALLGASVPLEEPPARLRERVLRQAARTPREPFERLPFTIGSSLAAQSDAPIRIVDHRRSRGRGLLLAAAAVVIVLAGVAGVLGWQVQHLNGEQQTQAAKQAQILSVLGDPSMRRAVLSSSDGQQAAVLLSTPNGADVLPVGLKPNDTASQIYIVWGFTTANVPVALSSFDVTGSGAQSLAWSAAAAQHSKFAISLEPGRTMPSAPTTVVASGQVTS